MTKEEIKVQIALGLFCDWIIPIKGDVQRIKCPHTHNMIPEVFAYVIVKAVNREHAHTLVRQAKFFTERNFSILPGWSNEKAAKYYRELHMKRLQGIDFDQSRVYVI